MYPGASEVLFERRTAELELPTRLGNPMEGCRCFWECCGDVEAVGMIARESFGMRRMRDGVGCAA